MKLGQGSSWRFDSLEAQACRPYNLGYFGEGATKKNQVLPPDTGKGVLKESGPAKTQFFSELLFWFFRGSVRVNPAKPGSFSQFEVFFWEGAIKK